MRIQGGRQLELRMRLTPGSTVRWQIRMDLGLAITATGMADQTLDAMVTSQLDCEVQRIEGSTALVRPYAHESDLWARGGTLTEDDVGDPMAGFLSGFLLDDLGSIVPMIDDVGSGLATGRAGDTAKALLLSLFPPFVDAAVPQGQQWEVELHSAWQGDGDPIAVQVALKEVATSSMREPVPVLLHALEYGWNEDGKEGALKLAAQSRLSPRDGWSDLTEANAELKSIFRSGDVEQHVTTTLRVVAERQL